MPFNVYSGFGTNLDLWGYGLVDFDFVTPKGIKEIDGKRYEIFHYDLLDAKTGGLIGRFEMGIPILGGGKESSEPTAAVEPGPSDIVGLMRWFDSDGDKLMTLSGLAVPFAEIKAGAGSEDDEVRYPYLVSLLDGDARILGSEERDRIEVGKGGKARVEARGGDDTVFLWQRKKLSFDGGKGSDMLDLSPQRGIFTGSPNGAVIDLADGTGTNPFGGKLTLKSVENMLGTMSDDDLRGNSADNFISGGFSGNDKLFGRGGGDLIEVWGNVPDGPFTFVADGGKGWDTLQFHLSIISYPIDDEGHVLDLRDPAENTGMFAGATIRNFEVYRGGDYHSPPLFPYFLDFRGSGAGETVAGTGGDDLLRGRGGNDTLGGGVGHDMLAGGPGRDNFLFDGSIVAFADRDRDTVKDFRPADDTIQLSLAAFHSAKFFSYGIKGDKDDGTGTLLAKYFHTGGGPRDGSDRIMYEAGTGKLLYDADGQKAAFPTVHIATLPEDLALRARDFELVA
jgi:Ca2+-binding RTX toxin-like protein